MFGGTPQGCQLGDGANRVHQRNCRPLPAAGLRPVRNDGRLDKRFAKPKCGVDETQTALHTPDFKQRWVLSKGGLLYTTGRTKGGNPRKAVLRCRNLVFRGASSGPRMLPNFREHNPAHYGGESKVNPQCDTKSKYRSGQHVVYFSSHGDSAYIRLKQKTKGKGDKKVKQMDIVMVDLNELTLCRRDNQGKEAVARRKEALKEGTGGNDLMTFMGALRVTLETTATSFNGLAIPSFESLVEGAVAPMFQGEARVTGVKAVHDDALKAALIARPLPKTPLVREKAALLARPLPATPTDLDVQRQIFLERAARSAQGDDGVIVPPAQPRPGSPNSVYMGVKRAAWLEKVARARARGRPPLPPRGVKGTRVRPSLPPRGVKGTRVRPSLPPRGVKGTRVRPSTPLRSSPSAAVPPAPPLSAQAVAVELKAAEEMFNAGAPLEAVQEAFDEVTGQASETDENTDDAVDEFHSAAEYPDAGESKRVSLRDVIGERDVFSDEEVERLVQLAVTEDDARAVRGVQDAIAALSPMQRAVQGSHINALQLYTPNGTLLPNSLMEATLYDPLRVLNTIANVSRDGAISGLAGRYLHNLDPAEMETALGELMDAIENASDDNGNDFSITPQSKHVLEIALRQVNGLPGGVTTM